MAVKRSPAIVFVAAILIAATARSEETTIQPGADINIAIARAQEGDVLRLAPGKYRGPLSIDRQVSIRGEQGAVIEGTGMGSVVTITAPNVKLEGLEITGSGKDLPSMDAAILVHQSAARAEIVNNRLLGNLFGVYLHGAAGSVVRNNLITGRQDIRLSERGNGVSIWNSPGAAVLGNRITKVRDGIFVITSRENLFENNHFSELRFAIHYMYTHRSRIIGNVSKGNHIAWAIMYSDGLLVRGNLSEGDRDQGLMLNNSNKSVVEGNVVREGGEKCGFLFNANRNTLTGNVFESCQIGIHVTAGSEKNIIAGNSFVNNRNQIKYVSTRFIDWAHEGRGNYWSDNPAFDLNGDGISDQPYRPNDIVDELLWTLPLAKLLINSPALGILRTAQSHFPAIRPGGVVDSAPLMDQPIGAEARSR